MKNRLVRWLSVLFALAAGLFFVLYAHRAFAGKDFSTLLSRQVLAATAALTLMYMLLIPTTAIAWTWLLRNLGQAASHGRILAILATAQFGKYLPGNVAQHVGRVAMARHAGIKLPATLFSVAYEMLLQLVACAHVSALTLLWTPPKALMQWKILQYRIPLLVVVTALAIAALMLAPRLASWLAQVRANRRGDQNYTPPRLHLSMAIIAGSYTMYVINFCIIGCGLWLVAHALSDGSTDVPSIFFLTGAFASSWILGFVAPGAPAGLGIREAILSAWLSGTLPAAQVVLLVVALRIATTSGDLINFALGSLAMYTQKWRKPPLQQ